MRCLSEMAMPCLPVREKHNGSTAFVGWGGAAKYLRFLAVLIAGRICHVTLLEKCYSNYNNSCVVVVVLLLLPLALQPTLDFGL